MKSPIVYRIAGVLLGVLVTLGVLEAAIRVLHLIPDNVPISYHAANGDEAFAPDANSAAVSVFGILHRTDSRGLRGPDRSLERVPGRIRVALVGDSVVWGYGIPEDQTIGAWLERLGEERGIPLDAWNLGVSAYNTFNERAKYARLAPVLRPDVTIVVVLFNDLQPVTQRFRISSAGTLSNPRMRAPYPDEWRPVLEKSALFNAAIKVYWRLQPPPAERHSLANLAAVIDQLDEIRIIAGRVGSTLVVAAMPSAVPDANQMRQFADGLRRFCEMRGVPFVDLASVLGRPARQEYLLPADPLHPTSAADRVIAEALLPGIREAIARR
jgi:lysophospholipase L1-like esterase